MLIITGYQTVFSQLAFAGKKENDPLAKSVPDAKIYLAKQLAKLSAANPGKVGFLRYVKVSLLPKTKGVPVLYSS